MDVSIIIVNYNTTELCIASLSSLFLHVKKELIEVIVVDNMSDENPAAQINDMFPSVRVVVLSRNLGFGQANNLGIAIARGRYIFLLNPDTLFVHDNIHILMLYMDLHPDVAVCGGTLMDSMMHPIHSYARFFPSIWSEFDTFFKHIPGKLLGFRNLSENRSGVPIDVAYITGANMMIRRSVFKDALFFDSEFFIYYEETELSLRLKKMGWRIVHVPTALLVHLEGRSIAVPIKRYRHIIESRRIFLSKVYGTVHLMNCCYLLYMSIVVFLLFLTIHFSACRRMCRKIPVFIRVNFVS